jgi:aldehyde:ferredoxin oxidoreductase
VRVYLGTGRVQKETLNKDFVLQYIGGIGLSGEIFYVELTPGTYPYGVVFC